MPKATTNEMEIITGILKEGIVMPASDSFKLRPGGTPSKIGAEIGLSQLTRSGSESLFGNETQAAKAANIGAEATGMWAGGKMMGGNTPFLSTLGGVAALNMFAEPGANLGIDVAHRLGAERGSAAEMGGAVAGAVGVGAPAYVAGQATTNALVNKFAETGLGQGLKTASTAVADSAVGKAASGALRYLGPVGAVAGAAQTGWSIGRMFGDRMTVGPNGLQWTGTSNDSGDQAASAQTQGMGVVDLAKETLGFGQAGREAAQDKVGAEIKAKQKEYESSQQYADTAKQDWRNLPDLVKRGNISNEDAMKQLDSYEKQAGVGTDTQAVRARLKQYGPIGENMEHNQYYHKLKTLLEQKNKNVINISEEGLGINFSGYEANPKAQRKARVYQKQLETRPEMSWSADSATVQDLPTTKQANGGIDPVAAVKNTVIKLMTDAQSKGIEMTHGEAHKMAMKMHGLR
jgi:hypothetical protein